jgi:hypothetical protein
MKMVRGVGMKSVDNIPAWNGPDTMAPPWGEPNCTYPHATIARRGNRVWLTVQYAANGWGYYEITGQCKEDLATIFTDAMNPPKNRIEGRIIGTTIF